MNTLARMLLIQGQLLRSSQIKINPAILKERDKIISESVISKEKEPNKS